MSVISSILSSCTTAMGHALGFMFNFNRDERGHQLAFILSLMCIKQILHIWIHIIKLERLVIWQYICTTRSPFLFSLTEMKGVIN